MTDEEEIPELPEEDELYQMERLLVPPKASTIEWWEQKMFDLQIYSRRDVEFTSKLHPYFYRGRR